MPTLKITDTFGMTLDATADLGSIFTKYLKSPGGITAVLHNLKPLADLRIEDDPFEAKTLGIGFTQPVALGNTGVELMIQPSVNGTISLTKGESLFDDETDPFRESIPIPSGRAYLAAVLNAEVVSASRSGQTRRGHL